MAKLTLSSLLLLPVLGCVTPAADDDDATYTRTIVRFADDGSSTVTTEPITASEQRLEHEAAVAAVAGVQAGAKQHALAIDSCGDWYATKFFDQTDYTGDELCLIGLGDGFLDAYCRLHYGTKGACLRTWSESARSLWTGESELSMESVYGAGTCAGGIVESWPAYEAVATLDACMQVADQFWIYTQ
jgi:hypothetical protein